MTLYFRRTFDHKEPYQNRKPRLATRPATSGGRGLAAPINASGTQTRKTVGIERTLPGEELLLRKLVATAGFLDSDPVIPYCGQHRDFAADYPSFCVLRRQLTHQKSPVRRFGRPATRLD